MVAGDDSTLRLRFGIATLGNYCTIVANPKSSQGLWAIPYGNSAGAQAAARRRWATVPLSDSEISALEQGIAQANALFTAAIESRPSSIATQVPALLSS